MAFTQYRPTSHFIAPHSWSNDPCGAVYIPETKEYLLCYQWNPGTTAGGNCAWGMAKSKDLVTWRDCTPPIQNGPSYDSQGVFSGSIVSRLIEGKRVLFLFYTSVSAVPIHWSMPYIDNCESQSVAVSTDFGASWHRYEHNPLLTVPTHGKQTTGWRDPFVSRWANLSSLLGVDHDTNYMILGSGKRGQCSQVQLYKSDNLLDWAPLGALLEAEDGARVSPNSQYRFGKNFECANFFSIGGHDYMIVGVEEDFGSTKHNGHCVLWLSGKLVLENGTPRFTIKSHGMLDHGISYAAHTFRDAEDRLIQLGWADETAKPHIIKSQGWAGCLAHPRELYEITKPIADVAGAVDLWTKNEQTGTMTTLGIRIAPQVAALRKNTGSTSLEDFNNLRSTNFEVKARFSRLSGREKFVFNVRQSHLEVTRLIVDLRNGTIEVDRSRTSTDNRGASESDSGFFSILPGEDLQLQLFVDESLVEVYANDRFAMTSRIYPSLETSNGASFDLGDFSEENVDFELWDSMKAAWPERKKTGGILDELHPLKVKQAVSQKCESVVTIHEGIIA